MQEPTSSLRWTMALATVVAITFCDSSTIQTTEDVVITRRDDSTETTKRRGTIIEWKGFALTLSSTGREREIQNDTIVEVQTNWNEQYIAGRKLLETGDLAGAITKLNSAAAAETRTWARRIIQADLVRAYSASENHLAAIQQFLAIIQEDPQTRFFYLCPLPWVASTYSIDQQAKLWIDSRQPAERLIGASWLMSGSEREKATKVLDELSRDIDANVKYLAIAQLWRARGLTANAKQIETWKKTVESMPSPLRAGPWFVIAETESRIGQQDSATIDLMRIPILYPDQISLSAAALYRAGLLLHNTGRMSEAQSVWDELRQNHAGSTWAKQAPTQIEPTDPSR